MLRFEWDLKTTSQDVWIEGDTRAVKLNDHHTAYYARMLIEERPDMWDFFELREAEGDPVGPSSVEPKPEPAIWDGVQRSMW